MQNIAKGIKTVGHRADTDASYNIREEKHCDISPIVGTQALPAANTTEATI